MQVLSIYRGARISAFKCREVTREIQGLPAAAAVDLLTFTPKKAARMVLKTLKSAIANAENNNDLRAEKLVVQEAVVGEGSTLKRFRPKARGSAGPIRKRSSNIRIILTDEIEIKPKPDRQRPNGAKKGARPPVKSGRSSTTPSESASVESNPAPESNS
jgi:large subunit ribosomal protein L22